MAALKCERCGVAHPVLAEVQLRGRGNVHARLYRLLHWQLRRDRNRTWHAYHDRLMNLLLYGRTQ